MENCWVEAVVAAKSKDRDAEKEMEELREAGGSLRGRMRRRTEKEAFFIIMSFRRKLKESCSKHTTLSSPTEQ